MDIYFLMGIGCFTVLGLWYERSRCKILVGGLMAVGSVVTVVSSFLLCVQTIGVYYPEKVTEIAGMLGLLQ